MLLHAPFGQDGPSNFMGEKDQINLSIKYAEFQNDKVTLFVNYSYKSTLTLNLNI